LFIKIFQKPRKRRYKEAANTFYGRKGCGLLLQAVVGPDRQFYDVSVKMPAAAGDWNAYHASRLYRKLRSDSPIPRGYQLLADSGYFADPYLLLPFSRMAHYTDEQLNYNYLHARGRVVVEHAFGQLKMKFRRLHNFPIAEDIDFVPSIVKAACILHNLCRKHRAPADEPAANGPEGGFEERADVPEGFAEAAEPDADPDRAAIRQEHDARRENYMRALPRVWVNRQNLLNRHAYYGDEVLL
jgi:hypothetical protein